MKKKTPFRVSSLVSRMTFIAAMTAASVILCRYLGYSPQNSAFRFDLGFLPVAFVGELLGPLASGGSYLLADLIGSLLSGYAPNPWISACKLIFGVLLGFGLYRKKETLPRVLVLFLIINVSVDLVLMTPGLIFLYDMPPAAAYTTRLINIGVTYPVRVFSFYFLNRALEKPLAAYQKHLDKQKNGFARYANSFQAVTVPGLDRIALLCEYLGHPEEKLSCIHIAGTNGKGSTVFNIDSILRAAGYRVGRYISPNLLRVNERIAVDDRDISDEELSELLAEIEPFCTRVEKETGTAPTQFEIWTAAAFLYFARKECDYVVLEVGLGGLYDATNVIPRNVVPVITRLDLDHMQYLGNTLSEIAINKAGIFKHDCRLSTAVTVEQDAEAMAVLRQKAIESGLSLSVVSPVENGFTDMYERFTLDGIKNITCGIPGYHQIENAALAVRVAVLLGIPEDKIRAGIAAARNPARLERLSENPTVIYDGGHNPNGIRALVRSLDRYYPNTEKTVIFACMADKDIAPSLSLLSDVATKFIFTTVKDNPRAMTAKDLAERTKSLGIDGEYYEEIGDAYETAVSRGRMVLICGSLYLYGDLMSYLHSKQ